MSSTKQNPKSKQVPNLAFGLLATLIVLLAGGMGQRWVDAIIMATDKMPVSLVRKLNTLPDQLDSWKSAEIPVESKILEMAGCDDYVSRRYIDAKTGKVVDLYGAYAARPAKLLGHRPEVCYKMHGWNHTSSHKAHLALPNGQDFDCLLHYFTKDELGTQSSLVVLNYYILRGRYATAWQDFWGPKWRLPNLSRDPNFYVAQIQLSTSVTGAVKTEDAEELVKGFAMLLAPHVRELLPVTAE